MVLVLVCLFRAASDSFMVSWFCGSGFRCLVGRIVWGVDFLAYKCFVGEVNW